MKNDFLDRLCELVAPPDDPQYNTGDWEAIENQLQLALPDDYKLLIETFGRGTFIGHKFYSGLRIANYLGPVPSVAQAEGYSGYLDTLGPVTFAVYPNTPGLLGCGEYADNDTLAWNTTGSPNQWSIVYHNPETGFHEIHGLGILKFAISVLEESSPLHSAGVIEMGEIAGPHTFRPEP